MKYPDQARRPAADLELIDDLVTHYRAAHALFAAVELGVFDALAGGGQQANALADAIGADRRAVRILLEALAALGFLERVGCEFRNAPVAALHLQSDSPMTLANNFRYQQRLCESWARLAQVVGTGEPAVSLPRLLAEDPGFVERYITAMADVSQHPARELAERLDLNGVQRLLDVGGGGGVYARSLVDQSPGLQAVILDLEPTLRVADRLLQGYPHRQRIELRVGDYLEADFGAQEYDVVLLSQVLHDEGEEDVKVLLKKSLRALRPGGRLVIHDFMPSAGAAGEPFAALFSLHMLVQTPKGRAYCADEYEAWLGGCGFVAPQRVVICADRATATMAIIATKP